MSACCLIWLWSEATERAAACGSERGGMVVCRFSDMAWPVKWLRIESCEVVLSVNSVSSPDRICFKEPSLPVPFPRAGGACGAVSNSFLPQAPFAEQERSLGSPALLCCRACPDGAAPPARSLRARLVT